MPLILCVSYLRCSILDWEGMRWNFKRSSLCISYLRCSTLDWEGARWNFKRSSLIVYLCFQMNCDHIEFKSEMLVTYISAISLLWPLWSWVKDLTNHLSLVCCPVAFYIISCLNFRHPKHYWIMSSFDMGMWEQIYFFSSQRKIYILWRRHMGTKPSMWLFFIFASVQCSQHIAKLYCFSYTNRKEVFSKRTYSFYVAG